jgi:hypothetical protein
MITSIFYKFYILRKPTSKKRFTIGRQQQQQQQQLEQEKTGFDSYIVRKTVNINLYQKIQFS